MSALPKSRILIKIGFLLGVTLSGNLILCHTGPLDLFYPKMLQYLVGLLPSRFFPVLRPDSSGFPSWFHHGITLVWGDEQQNQHVVLDFTDPGCRGHPPLRLPLTTPAASDWQHPQWPPVQPPFMLPSISDPVTMLFFCLKLSTVFSGSRPASTVGLPNCPVFP